MNIQQDNVLHSRNGKFDDGTTSHPSDVARILDEALKSAPDKGLVIHFHGGLNSEESGRNIANDLYQPYHDAGAYPLFFVWESGLVESLINNPKDILADPAFRELVKKVAEWVAKKLGGQVGTKGSSGQAINEVQLRRDFDLWFNGEAAEPPITNEGKVATTFTTKGVALNEDELVNEIQFGLDGDPDFQKAIQQLHNAVVGGHVTTKGSGTTAVAPVVLVSGYALGRLFPDTTATTKGALVWFKVATFVAEIIIKVIKRFATGRDHGVYCTIVEEVLRAAYLDFVGSTIWNQMKKDTVDSFGNDPQCCGTAVVKQLGTLHAAGKNFNKITLIGHSTGALYICEFLDAAAQYAPELKFDIIFLAPAVRHDRFASTLKIHYNQDNRIVHFRMFCMMDKVESDDVLIPILYIRSLLYFVSGLLEGHVDHAGAWIADIDAPILGMERYISNKRVYDSTSFPQIAEVRTDLQIIANSKVWSVTSNAGNGLSSTSKKHGDFDNDKITLDSIIYLIKNW